MKYISTRDKSKNFEFKDVFIKGLADDGGLFIPENLHKYTESEIGNFRELSYIELAKKIIGLLLIEMIFSTTLEKNFQIILSI